MLGRTMWVALSMVAANAWAGTSVFVENRTTRPLLFTTKQGGAPLDAEAWQAVIPVIAPGTRMEVLRFNRDSGIKSDQTYTFDTEVRVVPTGEVLTTLNQTLLGRDVNSRIEISARGGTRVTKDNTEMGTASWTSGAGSGVLEYHLTDDMQSDVEYVIADVATAALPADRRFELITYNVQMLPMSLMSHGQLKRAGAIPDALPDCDVVVLNEAFDDEPRAKLRNGLKRRWPHSTAVAGQDQGIGQDSGVFIVSRWPIVAQATCVFDQMNSQYEDRLAQKGAVYACIQRPDGRVHVVGTHLQAEQDEYAAATRKYQMGVIRKMILEQNIPKDEPVLIAGDLNVSWANTRERNDMFSVLDADKTDVFDESELSADPRTNELDLDSEAYLFDYVLISNAHRRPARSASKVLQLKGSTRMSWTHSIDMFQTKEVNTLDLSDHYPVVATFTF